MNRIQVLINVTHSVRLVIFYNSNTKQQKEYILMWRRHMGQNTRCSSLIRFVGCGHAFQVVSILSLIWIARIRRVCYVHTAECSNLPVEYLISCTWVPHIQCTGSRPSNYALTNIYLLYAGWRNFAKKVDLSNFAKRFSPGAHIVKYVPSAT